MQTAIICRNCGHADLIDVPPGEQQDLLTVGMFERNCPACKRGTRWGRGLDLRRKERRHRERRNAAKAASEADRRAAQRRKDRRRTSNAG